MKVIVLACVVVLTGCASHGSAVRCDGRLEPINTPTAHVAYSSTKPESDRE